MMMIMGMSSHSALLSEDGGVKREHGSGFISLLVLLSPVQVLNAVLRPHPGERFRSAWEWLHKGSGYMAILLGLVNVSLGTLLVAGDKGLVVPYPNPASTHIDASGLLMNFNLITSGSFQVPTLCGSHGLFSWAWLLWEL
jgi:hypothetical protein